MVARLTPDQKVACSIHVVSRQSPLTSDPAWQQPPYTNQGYAPPQQQQQTYAAPAQSYAQPPPPPPPQSNGGVQPQKRFDRMYSRIADNYNSLEEVTEALAQAGLESSNLIVGIDFTKSNEWTGKRSFNGRSLHHIGNFQNPYEQAISIIGRTLSVFDEDNLIPCYGFGDASTHDQDVFSFNLYEKPCTGFEEALARYREIAPNLRLAGPTSFAPIIEMATTIVQQSGGQYHVLLIIADGQVTRSVDTERGHLSPQEQKTVDAIVKASEYPLSIVLVGVGDGPWEMMKEFDDNIPARAFDNFQFVNFTEIMSKSYPEKRKETEFALSALMEIPSQYKATLDLNLLGSKNSRAVERVPLPPPRSPSPGAATANSCSTKPSPSPSSSCIQSAPASYSGPTPSVATAPPASFADFEDKAVCPICITNPKDMAFGCGHQTCCGCGQDLQLCPICRTAVTTRIKLYG